jgi:hypothetical protein
MYLIVLKSGSLSLLEHTGPVQACNEVALPLHSEYDSIVRVKIRINSAANLRAVSVISGTEFLKKLELGEVED